MYFNKLLFHPPSSKHSAHNLEGKVIWIPKQVPKKKSKTKKKKSKSVDAHENDKSNTDQATDFRKTLPNNGARLSDAHRQNNGAESHNEEIKCEIDTNNKSQSEKKSIERQDRPAFLQPMISKSTAGLEESIESPNKYEIDLKIENIET